MKNLIYWMQTGILLVFLCTQTSIIAQSGKVGVGTDAPLTNFEVVDQTHFNVDVTMAPYSKFGNLYSSAYTASLESMGDVQIVIDQNNNTTDKYFDIKSNGDNTAPLMRISEDGKVGFGTTNFATGYKVSIDGKMACEEVMVDLSGDWPDYVFQKEYQLLSLEEVQQHIDEKGHLPGVPSAKEVAETGVVLGKMNKVLMEKVEELTLYILQQEERIKALEAALEK